MKKLLVILLAITLCSCGSELNKKIVLTEYSATIEKIKASNTEYSEADFARASKLMNKLGFGAMASGSMKTDKTYRQLLDEAKAENEKDALEIKAYNDELDKLRAVMSVKVDSTIYFDEYSKVLRENYRALVSQITYSNLSQQNITGIEGKILVKNPAGKVIKTCYLKAAAADLMPAGITSTAVNKFAITDRDNLMELKANKPETYVYEWVPSLLIFDDGTRMEAPQKPNALLLEEL